MGTFGCESILVLAGAGRQPPGRHLEHPATETEGCRSASQGLLLTLITYRRRYHRHYHLLMSRGSIAVPDVLGLTFASAHSVGSAAGLHVLGYAPDGSPIAKDSEGIVVEQDPPAHESTKAGRQLRLRVGRGDGGSKDPEPRVPDPVVHSDFGDLSDPDADRKLV